MPWQLLPFLLLSFFNFHAPYEALGSDKSHHSIVPMRYFLVMYPALFIVTGIGCAFLYNWLKATAVAALKFIPVLIVAGLAVGQTAFCFYYINVLKESGKIISYELKYFVPNVREMNAMADALVDDFKLHPDDMYARVFSHGDFYLASWRVEFGLADHAAQTSLG